MPRTFDTSNLKGLKQAEAYKQKLEDKYNKVIVSPIGLHRVRIEGRN